MEITLPVGIWIPEKKALERRVVLKGLTGEARVKLGEAQKRKDPVRLFKMLLRASIEMIGDQVLDDKLAAQVMGRVVLPDQDYILTRSRICSFGKLVDTVHRCQEPGCGARVDATVDLEALEVVTLENPELDAQGQVIIRFQDLGEPPAWKMACRLPTVDDQGPLVAKMEDNESEAELDMIWRCATEVDGQKVTMSAPLPNDYFEKMALARCNAVVSQFSAGIPGIDKDANGVRCFKCRQIIPWRMDVLGYFFGPGARPGRKRPTS